MDTGLDENQAELGVLVLAVALEVLADGDSLVSLAIFFSRVGGLKKNKKKREFYLLDQEVEVLGKLGGEACYITLSALTKQRQWRPAFLRSSFRMGRIED